MSSADKPKPNDAVSRRGFITGVAVGSVGAVVGREAVAQEFIETGLTLDDLEGNWWETDTPTDPTPPPEVDPEQPPFEPPTQPEATFSTRQNIYALDPNGSQVQSLRRGIAAMQQRPVSDPTSWQFQSNVHGVSGFVPPGIPPEMLSTWETCQHGRRFFLSWHRMYLLFFERMLRQASGDPSLSLPYWDYSVPGQNALPLPFRFPANPSNPLYRFERFGTGGRINQGQPLPWQITNTFAAMQTQSFAPFGFASTVESTPHNGVHVAIGGVGGLMTDPATAALDPIFWLHHCNVDRLWNRWIGLGGGRSQPTNDWQFMNERYAFFDENRQRVTMSGREVLETAQQLGYRYDDDPNPPVGSDAFLVASADTSPPPQPVVLRSQNTGNGPQPVALAMAMAAPAALAAPPQKITRKLAEAPRGLTLGTGSSRLKLRSALPEFRPQPVAAPAPRTVRPLTTTTSSITGVPSPSFSVAAPEPMMAPEPELLPAPSFRTAQTAAEPEQVVLQLEGIEFDAPPGIWYDIYVNMPDDTPPDPRGPYYAGLFAPFAHNKTGGETSFDITGLLNRQIDAGLFDESEEVDVKFIASSTDGKPESVDPSPVKVGSVSVLRS